MTSIQTICRRGVLGALLMSFASSAFAQDRTTEQGEAQISDPNAECVPYYYAPSASRLSSFPPIWQPATLLANDSAGQAKWSSIASGVPNIAPKGSLTGDFSNTTPTYSNDDPDCWWTYHQCVTPKLSGLPMDIASVPEPQTMGIGFDDGPNCSHNAFYDYLQQNNQKATMFYIGSNVLDWPLEAQRGLADGHELCVHTWSHRYMTAFSSQDAFAELYYTMQAIKLVTGVTPTCWRPPFGDVDDRIRYIANALGLRTILWKYDSFDWQNGVNGITPADVDNKYQMFLNNATSGQFATEGAIILTHELNNFTMSEMEKFYPQLKQAFQHIVPVGVAMNKTQPYVESNYSLPDFASYVGGTTTTNGSSAANSSQSAAAGQTKNNTGVSLGMPLMSGLLTAVFGIVLGAWTVGA